MTDELLTDEELAQLAEIEARSEGEAWEDSDGSWDEQDGPPGDS
jgi:hypothetical protein